MKKATATSHGKRRFDVSDGADEDGVPINGREVLMLGNGAIPIVRGVFYSICHPAARRVQQLPPRWASHQWRNFASRWR
jgi:hypothetical protein